MTEDHELLSLRSIIILELSPAMSFVVLQNYRCGNTSQAWKNLFQDLQVLQH